MKFVDTDGTSYLIEFERQNRVPEGQVIKRKKMGDQTRVERKYTTAKVLKVTGTGKQDRAVVREYTVGHNPRDRFSFEAGRKYALTMALYDSPTKGGGSPLMGRRLTKEFRTKVWNAYFDRFSTEALE